MAGQSKTSHQYKTISYDWVNINDFPSVYHTFPALDNISIVLPMIHTSPRHLISYPMANWTLHTTFSLILTNGATQVVITIHYYAIKYCGSKLLQTNLRYMIHCLKQYI